MADNTSANDTSEQSDKATSSQFEGDAATTQPNTTTTQPDGATAQPDATTAQPNAVAVPPEEEDTHISWSTLMAVFFMGISYVPAISAGLLLPSGILQQIGQTLGDTENTLWIPGGWSVGSAVSFAVAGGLSDIFGRRWVLISGQALTLIGCIIGGTADKTTNVAAGSSIVGFGAGVVFVSYPGIVELLPNKYRGIGIGWTEFCINIPWGALSAYLATLFYIHATWRWVYFIGIIYAVVAMVGTFFFYFPPSRPRHDFEKTRWQEFKELDFIGLLLFTGGLTIFLVGITYLGRSNYSTSLVASTIPIGAIIFICTFIYDFTIPKNPIFPFKLLSMFRKYTVHLVILFISGMIWQAIVTLGPQATLWMYTNDPVEIGKTLIPSNFSGVLGGWILPSLVHKIKHIRYQILFALLMQTAFTAAYAAVVPHKKAAWMAMQLFGQSCFTWVTTLAYVSSSLYVPLEELGVSAGLIGTFRSAGGSVGNAIFSTIMTSIVNDHLTTNIVTAAVGAGYPANNVGELIPAVIQNAAGAPNSFAGVPDVTNQVISATATAVKNTYAHAFRLVFYSTIPFGVIAFAVAWFVSDPSDLLNNHVAVHQEREVLAEIEHKRHEHGHEHGHGHGNGHERSKEAGVIV